jgi:hypothetical protein
LVKKELIYPIGNTRDTNIIEFTAQGKVYLKDILMI